MPARKGAAAKTAASIRIGLQLYSVRKECEKDGGKNLPNVLEAVAAMGYAGVEFAGYYGWSAEDLRLMLDDNGLACCGAHVGLETLLGDSLDRSADFHRTLGNQFLIVPGLKEPYRCSPDAWERTAELFNEIHARLKPHLMRTGYHNHSVEFQPMEGCLPWEVFGAHTDRMVVLQLDIGNCMDGGGDPVHELRRFPGRGTTVHLKEFGGPPQAVIGEGQVRWQEILDLLATSAGTKWQIVEHEREGQPPMEGAERCLRNLHRMLGK
jgi:sugar phosphate isomerase/epimerase